jgi:thiosulfate reductase cytochrome b subunit
MVVDRALAGGRVAVYRHPLIVRVTHWINALCLLLLLMSGLQILNTHPALYWGETSRFSRPLFAFGSGDALAFPTWITLAGWQDLASGRRWHFFFAWLFVVNGFTYAVYALTSGRIRWILLPHGAPLRLWLERQPGYKMAKYIMRIDAIDSFSGLGRGKGGYWEDRGYQWYAGI